MRDDLRVAGVLPLVEPYSALGYTYIGGQSGTSISPALLAITGVNAVVDWVVVELRSATNPAILIESRPALVQRDGDVMAPNGQSWMSFSSPAGSYHVAIKHRAHLAIRTAAPVALGQANLGLNFRLSSTTYGTNATKDLGATFGSGLWPGDSNGDGMLKYTGSANDRDPILVAVGGSNPNNVLGPVYDRRDTNMDGAVKYTGTNNDRDVVLSNLSPGGPNDIRMQQVP